LSTALHEKFDVQPHVVELILGHSGPRSGIQGVYNLANYIPQRRVALEKWANHVVGLATGVRPSTVITLRR
jgi:hypothetical protein